MTWYRSRHGCVLYPPGQAEPADEELPEPAVYAWGDGETYENPELGRQILRGSEAAITYAARIRHLRRPAPGAAWPSPHSVGTPEWYDFRTEDYLRRCPNAQRSKVSGYYQDYGKKYCLRFSSELYPELTEPGRDWVIDVRMRLHLAIEEELLRDPEAFAELERDEQGFERMAYDTHADAYLDAGLASLPIADLSKIFAAPDVRDLLTPKAVLQVVETAPAVAKEHLKMLLHPTERT